jgi:hypothetical protein
MSLFDIGFIKNLFTQNFPSCCSNWNNLDNNNTINDYGLLLKSFSNITNNSIEQMDCAKKINNILDTKYEDAKLENFVATFNNLKLNRKNTIKESNNSYFSWFNTLPPVPNLSNDNDEVWGSKRQYLYGQVCSEIMKKNNIDLPPFLCSALNPTGGICGAGNQSLYTGNASDPVIVHSCIHDASGYCYNYHKMGVGYNYLNTWFALPTFMPMSCQMMGIWTCWSVKQSVF